MSGYQLWPDCNGPLMPCRKRRGGRISRKPTSDLGLAGYRVIPDQRMNWVEGAAPRETGQTQWDEFHYLAKVMVAVRVPSSHSKFWLQLGRWTRSSLRTVLLTQQLPITGT